jgi:hypothetical protein
MSREVMAACASDFLLSDRWRVQPDFTAQAVF